MALTAHFSKFGVVAVLIGGVLTASPQPVLAQSFLDRLFNPKNYDDNGNRRERAAPAVEKKKAPVKVRISGPRYFSYSPDAFETLSLSKLATIPPMPEAPAMVTAPTPEVTPEDAGTIATVATPPQAAPAEDVAPSTAALETAPAMTEAGRADAAAEATEPVLTDAAPATAALDSAPADTDAASPNAPVAEASEPPADDTPPATAALDTAPSAAEPAVAPMSAPTSEMVPPATAAIEATPAAPEAAPEAEASATNAPITEEEDAPATAALETAPAVSESAPETAPTTQAEVPAAEAPAAAIAPDAASITATTEAAVPGTDQPVIDTTTTGAVSTPAGSAPAPLEDAAKAVPSSADAEAAAPTMPKVEETTGAVEQAPAIEAPSVSEPARAPTAAPSDKTGALEVTGDSVATHTEPTGVAGIEAFNAARRHLTGFNLRTLPAISKAMIGHYSEPSGFLWVSEGAVNDKAKAAIAAMARAAAFGLNPKDYAVVLPALDVAAASDGEADVDPVERAEKELVRFEMDLTAKVLLYALDARRGRVDPNRISGYHDLPRKSVDLDAIMAEVAASGDVAAYLESTHPDNDQFKALVAARADLAGADEAERIEIADGTLIKPGQSNPELGNVIAGIRSRASAALKEKHAETLAAYQGDDAYTPELEALVRDYQREAKLTVDGIIGPGTIRSFVGDSNAAKIRKLDLAMERLRWLPETLGPRYVFINQPAFVASYFRPNREPLSMRVVVGSRSNQTSFFMDRIETVEFNPYWGVPLSIIVNEMMPKLNRDPSYLDRAGYEVTTASGKRVSSGSVDWHAVATRSSSINVRQVPGRSNALGELKILFPNKHAIYMHDTPQKALFNRDSRAFSHGCVRLQHPRLMAAAILDTSTDYIASRIAKGQNESEAVKQNIPIYVAYFTAWPDETGKVGFFHDVYERDRYLAKAIESTEAARGTRG